MIGPAWLAGIGPCQRPSGWSRGSRSVTAPGLPSTSTANRWSCCWTRSRMNGSWFFASFASVKQNSSSPRSMNSRGVHANTSIPSRRPPVSGIRSATPRRGGAQKRTLGNGAGATPIAAQPSAAPSAPVRTAVRLVEPQQVLALDVEDQHPQVRGGLADDRRARPSARAGRTARTRSSSRRRRCRRSTCGRPCARRRSRGRRAPGAPSRPRPDRQRPLHLVGVERAAAFLAGRRGRRFAGVGGDPDLGVDPGDGDGADRTFCAGMMPSSAIRCVSDS